MTNSGKDFYKRLEISRTAKPEEIKKAYHRLARKYHPDKNKDDPKAEDHFKEIKEAYETLTDENKRIIYDCDLNKKAAPTATFTTPAAPQRKQPQTASTTKPSDIPKYTFFSEKADYENQENTKAGWQRYRSTSFPTFPGDFDFDEANFTHRSDRTKKSKTTPRSRQPFSERPPWNDDFSSPEESTSPTFGFRGPENNIFNFMFFCHDDPFSKPGSTFEQVFEEFFKEGDSFFGGIPTSAKRGAPRKQGFHFNFDAGPTTDGVHDADGSFFTQYKKHRDTQDNDAFVKCKHCFKAMSVEKLILHEPKCPNLHGNMSDEEERSPRYFKDWRDAHEETLNSIRRDRQRSHDTKKDTSWDGVGFCEDPKEWDSDLYTTTENPNLLRCPYCYRTFNKQAAMRHVPFCLKKTKESGRAPNPLGRPVASDYTSKTFKAKQYAKNIPRPQPKRENGEGTSNNSSADPSDESDDEMGRTSPEMDPRRTPSAGLDPAGPNPYKATFPDINSRAARNLSGYASRYRRHTTAGLNMPGRANVKIDLNFAPNLSPDASFAGRLGQGCEKCVRTYGRKKARFVCSCGSKKAV